MELALDIIGERFTTLYQMSKPTYLSRDVFASLEIGILTYINHGEQVARLPVSYTSSLSFCHSSHVVVLVVYFILLSVVSKFCSGLRGMFSSHTGQHEKLVPVSPVHSILCTYCQIIFVWTVTFNYFILQTKCLSAITNDVFVYQAVVEWWCMVTIRTSLLL